MKKLLLLVLSILAFNVQNTLIAQKPQEDRVSTDTENVLRYALKNSLGSDVSVIKNSFKDSLEQYKKQWGTPESAAAIANYEKAFNNYANIVTDFKDAKASLQDLTSAEKELDKADKNVSMYNKDKREMEEQAQAFIKANSIE